LSSCLGGNSAVDPDEKFNSKTLVTEVEQKLNKFLDSLKTFELEPIDSIFQSFQVKQQEKFAIRNNTIHIYKKDSVSIDWIKINSHKFSTKGLKTINSRTDGLSESMFCQSLQRIKLYRLKKRELLFLEFTSHPCNGLACSVSDYILYDIKNRTVNLFGNFRGADLDLYNFPISSGIDYIAMQHKGDLNGGRAIQFIHRIYSLNHRGEFDLAQDSNEKEYFYEVKTYPNDLKKDMEFRVNWF